VFVVGADLYFTDATSATAGGISWCPADKCTAPTRTGAFTGAFGFAADANGVAVAEINLGRVYVFPARFAANAIPTTRGTIAAPQAVALDANNVYFSTADGSVHRVGRAAGAVTRISTGTGKGGAVTTDATRVYWASDGSGGGTCAGGCLQDALKTAVDATTTGVSLGRSPRTLTYEGDRLFWTAAGAPYNGEVSWRLNLQGNEFFYARTLGEPYGITADANAVYFTVKSDGSVRKVARAAAEGPTETIAIAQSAPRGIAIDAKAVYWADAVAGAVMKLAR